MKEDTQAEGLRSIPLSLIELNTGQLEGLPQNPRSIKKDKYDKLKKSIQDYPEMLKYRSLLVYPLDNGHFIIIGGNMRLRALRELGYTEAPCIVIPKETPVDRLQAYTIQDNNEFGEWDWDLLANEWDESLLEDWGIDKGVWYEPDLFGDPEKEIGNEKENKDYFSVTFTFEASYEDSVKEYIKANGKAIIVDKIVELCQNVEVK